MKKFIVDRIEIKKDKDGYGYYYAVSDKGENWYEFLKTFKPDTQKVMYYNDTHKVISIETDASMLAPTFEGITIQEIEPEPYASRINLYFIDDKLVNLSEYEEYKDGVVLFNREEKIKDLLQDINATKEAKINKGILINHGEKEELYQPIREKDMYLLDENKDKLPKEWKFYTKDGEPKMYTLTKELYAYIITTKPKVFDALMEAEVKCNEELKEMTDDELRTLDGARFYINKYFELGGVL